MENVTLSVRGTILTITVDLSLPGSPSSTGKTRLVATTRGAVSIEHPRIKGLKAAVNITAPL